MGKGLFEFKKVLQCVLLAFVVTLILCGILAFLVFYLPIEEQTARTVIFAMMIVSVLFSGFVLAKNVSKNGLLNGLLMALIYFLAVFLVTLAVNGKTAVGVSEITRLITLSAAGMLGGILGINT